MTKVRAKAEFAQPTIALVLNKLGRKSARGSTASLPGSRQLLASLLPITKKSNNAILPCKRAMIYTIATDSVEATKMPEEGIRTVLWWFGLVIAPLVLIAIELFHPAHFTYPPGPGMYQFLSQPEPYDPRFVALAYPGPDWWFLLHMIQTPLVGLVAVGLWLLVDPVVDADGHFAVALAWLSRAATLVFLIYYTALDSIGGTGLGRLLINTQCLASGYSEQCSANNDSGPPLTPDQIEGIARLLNTNWVDPWVGGVDSFISHAGSYAVLASSVFAASSLALARKIEWPALVLLLAFGWQLQTSHASPHGPIAFGLLILAALWSRWSERSAFISDRVVRWPRRSAVER
ncbi:MAG: hypothetical protein AB7H71_02080 [Alphaproteobacteria bacterium]